MFVFGAARVKIQRCDHMRGVERVSGDPPVASASVGKLPHLWLWDAII